MAEEVLAHPAPPRLKAASPSVPEAESKTSTVELPSAAPRPSGPAHAPHAQQPVAKPLQLAIRVDPELARPQAQEPPSDPPTLPSEQSPARRHHLLVERRRPALQPAAAAAARRAAEGVVTQVEGQQGAVARHGRGQQLGVAQAEVVPRQVQRGETGVALHACLGGAGPGCGVGRGHHLGQLGAERGDVVVFRYPVDPGVNFIKRLIGLPGDAITYRNKELFVNGESFSKLKNGRYTSDEVKCSTPRADAVRFREAVGDVEHDILLHERSGSRNGQWVVPEGHYFVMGDNRDRSNDSRGWGFVPEENLLGRAEGIWLNFDFDKGCADLSRVGDGIN